MGQQSGNALLITMVIIAVVGTVGFGVSRVAISALKTQNRLEDSANAYQAAMAGIEDGLLRWRFDKQVEVPGAGSGLDCPDPPTLQSQYYTRVNVTTGKVTPCILPDELGPPAATDIVYDLKIAYKRPPGEDELVTSVATSSGGNIPALRRDRIVEYDVQDLVAAGGDIRIGVRPSRGDVGSSDLLEVAVLNTAGELVSKMILTHAELIGSTVDRPRNLGLSTLYGQDVRTVRLKYIGQDLAEYRLSPSHAGTASAQLALDSRQSTIDAIGYFGLAKRRLVLDLDRYSGSALSVFDYLLYSSGEGDIRPSQ